MKEFSLPSSIIGPTLLAAAQSLFKSSNPNVSSLKNQKPIAVAIKEQAVPKKAQAAKSPINQASSPSSPKVQGGKQKPKSANIPQQKSKTPSSTPPIQKAAATWVSKNPPVPYDGTLTIVSAKHRSSYDDFDHEVRRLMSIQASSGPHCITKEDLPRLPIKEGTSVENLFEALTRQNRNDQRPGSKKGKKNQRKNYAASSIRLRSNMAGPAPVKVAPPKLTHSYAAISRRTPGVNLYLEGTEDSAYIGFLLLEVEALNAKQAAAEELHRKRYQARIAEKDIDLRQTKHLHDLHSAYRTYWNVDLRGTVFQKAVLHREPRRSLTKAEDTLSYTLCYSPLAKGNGSRPQKNNLRYVYLLGSFMANNAE